MDAVMRGLRRWPCEIWFCFGSLMISLPLAMPPFRSLASYANWMPGYYYVNYGQFGFVKRGLIGSLFSLLGVNRLFSPALFTCLVHVSGLLVLSLLFWLFAYQCTRNLGAGHHQRKPWLYAFAVASPALFLHFGYDLGRIDLFGLNITLLALLVLISSGSALTRSMAVVLATVVGLLSHEAYLFFWLPLLGFGFLQSLTGETRRTRWFALGTWIGLVVVLLAILRLWGAFEPGSAELSRRFSAIDPSLAGALRIELTSDLVKDNIDLAAQVAKRFNWWGNSYAIAVYAAITAFGYLRFLRRLSPYWASIAVAVPVFPLMMNQLGVDYIRHLSCSITAACVCSLLIVRATGCIPSIFRPRLAWVPIVFIFLGPLGSGPNDPLPLLRYLPL